MRVMETDTPDNFIGKLKCSDEGETIRLTFQWPIAIEQVYVFKTGEVFDIETASPKDARLYTLQEYKKLGGFIDRKTPGIHTYRVYPFIRDAGEDVAVVQPEGNAVTCLTGQVIIRFSIKERKSWPSGDKVNEVTLLSEHYVEDGALCYVKKENAYPSDVNDGIIYALGEPLLPGVPFARKVKTHKNEFIRLFVCNTAAAALYKLQTK